MLYPPIQTLETVGQRRTRDNTSTTTETCPHGDPDCPGPDGDELPCFPCYVTTGERA
jgi:hypothetical protein